MLTKSARGTAAPAGSGQHKRAPAGGGAAPAPIQGPKADWAPLWIAPFFCTRQGYNRSLRKWTDRFSDEVRRHINQIHEGPRHHKHHELIGFSIPDFSIQRGPSGNVKISAMGISTWIEPGWIRVDLDRDKVRASAERVWSISGVSDEILTNEHWDDISSDRRLAAQWHRCLLDDLLRSLNWNFVASVISGAVHIMARKNSVFAPFERVTWDQWQFFRLDEGPTRSLETPAWCDPREPADGVSWRICMTATGPGGDRLYALYIAPVAGKTDFTDGEETLAEKKCLQWLLKLLHEYPDRAPEPLRHLRDRASAMFPGLPKRAFDRSYFFAQAQTGNRNWSLARRPRKSQQKLPHKE
jgi:hypothetical protein